MNPALYHCRIADSDAALTPTISVKPGWAAEVYVETRERWLRSSDAVRVAVLVEVTAPDGVVTRWDVRGEAVVSYRAVPA